jgi:hypothetical protein
MTSRLAAAMLAFGSVCVALPLASAQPDVEVVKESTVELPLGKSKWDMSQLDRDPVKLVKYSATQRQIRIPPPFVDPEKPEKPAKPVEQTSVEFILEFTRDLTVRDTDWTGVRPEPPFRFDFLDKDGVTITTQTAKYEGIPLGRKGRRVRIALLLPPERVMSRITKVLVEPKRYAELQ